jgi:DNA-binding response OmpR family regulator
MVKRKQKFENVSALIALSNPQLMGILYYFLNGIGVGNVMTARTSLDALRQVEQNEFGICFVDYDIDDMGGPDLVRFIRTCSNKSAFSKIFTVIKSPDQTKVYAARDAGTHDILGLPLTTGLLKNRLYHLLHNPKPFVDTVSYVGPCRRLEKPVVYSGEERRTSELRAEAVLAVGY